MMNHFQTGSVGRMLKVSANMLWFTCVDCRQSLITSISSNKWQLAACCWWGRGSTQVKGVCMYGKLNYYIGARAKEEGRKSMFPDIDVRSLLWLFLACLPSSHSSPPFLNFHIFSFARDLKRYALANIQPGSHGQLVWSIGLKTFSLIWTIAIT